MKMYGHDSTDAAKRLRVVVWKDKHSRRWDLTLDREAFTHTAPPLPLFRAPLMPPHEYVRTDPDRIGRVLIDYEAWATAWEEAERIWRERYRAAAQHIKNEEDLKAVVGPMPESAEFVRAAQAGNRWVLGLPHPTPGVRYKVPAWAQPILDRLAPRPLTPTDRDEVRRRARAHYADEVEDVEEAEILEPLGASGRRVTGDFDEPDEDETGADPDSLYGDEGDEDDAEIPDDDVEDVGDDDLDDEAHTAAVVAPPVRRGGRRRRGG